MSGPEDNTPEVTRDDPMIAAEWALGLLEGEELLAARGKYATDPAFAWRKEWWDGWFAPLSDAIPGAEPGEHVWDAIAARVAAAQAAANAAGDSAAPAANVVALEARVRLWQRVAGLSSIAAAALLAWMVLTPAQTIDTPQPAELLAATEPMVAIVPIGDTGLRLDVTYIPGSERMVVAAIGLTPDGVHDHELWLVPKDDGPLQSLGVVKPGEVRSMILPASVTAKLGRGAGLVLTREPIGGKPEGKEAGPVVASGAFKEV
ncbi:anti-sigma factor [Erythrobacter donghaensis]|jgi:anti-sigma-K factor RskA|uniref:anti-sigma factor n=1 Tax=Erythrobacter donghaensis TaxID=267135 RepID=UPI00093F5AAD|nr:anti-sigma factor [Erythrobacter donghaensis]